MPSIEDFSDLPLILTFFVPGVLFQWGRAFFNPSLLPKVDKDSVGTILVVSVVYAICVSVVSGTSVTFLKSQPDLLASVKLFAYAILVPLCLGLVVGFCDFREFLPKLGWKHGASVFSALPTSWDAMAAGIRQGSFLIITLEDGHKIAGRVGEGTRIGLSSQSKEPDIFLDELFVAKEGGGYKKDNFRRGAWVPGEKIKVLEVINPQ